MKGYLMYCSLYGYLRAIDREKKQAFFTWREIDAAFFPTSIEVGRMEDLLYSWKYFGKFETIDAEITTNGHLYE